MPQPTPSDVHVDAALTNVSVAFQQANDHFVAGQVFPTVPVDKQTNKYYTWDRNNLYRDEMQRRPPATESAGGGMEVSTDSYTCDVFALHKDIDDQLRANADPAIDPESASTLYLTQQGLIRRDRQWATDYFGTGIWTTDVVGTTDFTKWDDAASDPEADVQTGVKTILQNTGYMPNRMVVGFEVHQALKRHPVIKDRFKYTSSESITAEMLARFFEIERYVVARGVFASNDEGAASDTYAFIHGKNCLLCHAATAPALNIPSAGYLFVWAGYTGLNNLGTRMKNFRMENIESDRIEIGMAFDMKKVAADLGYFFSAAVS